MRLACYARPIVSRAGARMPEDVHVVLMPGFSALGVLEAVEPLRV
ncbi:GlxA family transcriptional regulator, partial [Burkholderia pseudomallei]